MQELSLSLTLFHVIHCISVFGFADDHTAIIRFKPTSAEEEEAAIHVLQECAVIINDWMNANKLKMNTSKTESIMFGSRQQLDKCSTNEILVCDDNIELQHCIRYLIVFLDDTLLTLGFKDHIKRKCQIATLNYFKIKSIRKYLTRNPTEVLCLSLVISHLDYCNGILYGTSQTALAKLQRIQNMFAKLVLNRSMTIRNSQCMIFIGFHSWQGLISRF